MPEKLDSEKLFAAIYAAHTEREELVDPGTKAAMAWFQALSCIDKFCMESVVRDAAVQRIVTRLQQATEAEADSTEIAHHLGLLARAIDRIRQQMEEDYRRAMEPPHT